MSVVEQLYDPHDEDFQNVSHDIYRRLRDEYPVYRGEQPEGWSLYALSRFDDVLQAAHDPATFSSVDTNPYAGLMPMIVFMDPPRHDDLRALVSRAFTPRRVAELEPRVREITRRLIDGFAANGEVDIMPALAAPLPSLVIAEMIGVPPEHVESFRSWTEQIIDIDPTNGAEPIGNIYNLFVELLELRRNQRESDLMSALLDAEVDGVHLTDEELLGFCFILIVGGNDTTTSLIGNGLELLARHPDQRASLVRDPSQLPNAIEEMLRLEPPAQVLARRATREVELHGVTIPAEARVDLIWAAANLDEREFEDPERFDINRRIDRHLAFGHGLHYCLGASLARLESRVAFEELLARFPNYEVMQAERHRSIWARAFKTLELQLSPGES